MPLGDVVLKMSRPTALGPSKSMAPTTLPVVVSVRMMGVASVTKGQGANDRPGSTMGWCAPASRPAPHPDSAEPYAALSPRHATVTVGIGVSVGVSVSV